MSPVAVRSKVLELALKHYFDAGRSVDGEYVVESDEARREALDALLQSAKIERMAMLAEAIEDGSECRWVRRKYTGRGWIVLQVRTKRGNT